MTKTSFPIGKVVIRAVIIGLVFPYLWMAVTSSGKVLDESVLNSPEVAELHGKERDAYMRSKMRPKTHGERITSVVKLSVTHWDVYLLVSTLIAALIYAVSLVLWFLKQKAP
jgi:hypothetical protein